MNQVIIIVALIVGFFMTAWSQVYYEASGRTAVFKLAAGEKTGPAKIQGFCINHGMTISDIRVEPFKSIRVIAFPNLWQEAVDIQLFDIRGRQIYLQQNYKKSSLRLDTRSFAPGIYGVLVRSRRVNNSFRIVIGQ